MSSSALTPNNKMVPSIFDAPDFARYFSFLHAHTYPMPRAKKPIVHTA